jgi:hypothetical protein
VRYYRKIIRVTGHDSPNVRRAKEQQARGLVPDGKVIVPGVLTWDDYCKRLATWDAVRICVGIDACFYVGAEILLFPPAWLNRAEEVARNLAGSVRRARAIGIDPAEGGDKTAMAAVDELGLIELVSKKTPDTTVVTSEALAFMRKYSVDADKVVFDRGGGGKEHADRLRSQGYKVRTVAFGESLMAELKRQRAVYSPLEERQDQREDRYAYVNRRAEMYGELSLLLDPALNERGFALPAGYTDLRQQLSVIRKEYDGEGRMMLPPKTRKPGQQETERKTLTELIGRSPDEADALVLAVHGMLHKAKPVTAGAINVYT